MDFSTINFLAVIVVTIISFAFGSIWYGPLFGKKWQKELGFTDEYIREGNMAKIFGSSFVLIFLMNFGLAFIFTFVERPEFGMIEGAMYGGFIGLFFIGTSTGVNMLYQRQSFSLWAIDSFYQIIYLTISGSILAIWK
jgi:multisubunit Na+/H+ antiporter MnhB subunit